FGYTTALNYMLANPRQRMQLDGNTTVVFWSERKNGEREESLLAQLLDLRDLEGGTRGDQKVSDTISDPETAQIVRDVLEKTRQGQPIDFASLQVDPNARFFILGLSPNSSRLSVRFWHVDTFGR